MLPNYLTNSLQKIPETEGFTDYEFETEAGCKHGDNFFGALFAVTLTGTKEQKGTLKPSKLHLICKAVPLSKTRCKSFKIDLVFGREIYVYSQLLPAFVRFQQDNGLDEANSFRSFPKAYASELDAQSDSYVLIMEDLRPKRYVMWPKEKLITIDHEMLVMLELGKLHAISFAMKDQRPNQFQEYMRLKDVMIENSVRGKFRPYVQKTVEYAANVVENAEHKQLLLRFRHTFVDMMEEFLCGALSKEFAVVGHGDCWLNNILFQHDDENQNEVPKSVCFLDWQMTRCGPPVLDILYNIFGATDGQFRKHHYDRLLNAYYASLSNAIRALGSDPTELYTHENFQGQMKKFGEFGLLWGLIIIRVRVANADDIENMDEYAERVERGEDVDLVREFTGETLTKFTDLVNELVADLADYGYLEDLQAKCNQC